MSWNVPEQRSESPEIGFVPTPHRSTKLTRLWCRGKVGVPHQVVLREDKNFASIKNRRCEWVLWYVRGREPKPHYSCVHERGCSACGKVLEYRVPPMDCPHFRPAPHPVRNCLCDCGHILGRHEEEPKWSWRSGCEHPACDCRRFHWVGFT